MLKIFSLPSIPDTIGMVARMMGTAPRSPAQDIRACSCHGILNGSRLSRTSSGLATIVRTRPMITAGQKSAPRFVRGDQQSEQDEHADLGDPAEPVGEAAGGGPVGQLGVAEHHRGEVDARGSRSRAPWRRPRRRVTAIAITAIG